MNKNRLAIGLTGILALGCIAPSMNVYASSSEYHSDIQEEMYKYMVSSHNQNSVTDEAIRLHYGDEHNTCVYFMSTILRRVGVDIPKSTSYTTTLKNQLEDRGWVRDTNLSNLKPGDVVFCGTSHVYMFMGWANSSHTIANVVDNQRHIYGTVYRQRYVYGHTVPGDSIRSHDKSTEFYRYVGNKSNSTQKTYKGKVVNINSYLNVRSGATTNSGVVGRVYNNQSVDIVSKVGSWYKILYNGRIVYVHSDYIRPTESSNSSNNSSSHNSKRYGKVRRVNSYLNIRSGASTGYRSVGTLHANQKVEVLDSHNGWYKIKSNGTTGWVYGYYLAV